MYPSSMVSPQAAPVIIVQERRSVCARLVAFLVTLFSGYVLVSMLISVGLFMSASDQTLQEFTEAVKQAAHETRYQAAPEQVSVEPDMSSFVPVQSSVVSETKPSFVHVYKRVMPRVAAAIFAAVVLAALLMAAYYLIQAYVDTDALYAQLLDTKETVFNTLSQFFNEVSTGATSVFNQVVSFDYEGLWNDIVAFVVQVWEEIKSYFNPATEQVQVYDASAGETVTMDSYDPSTIQELANV